MISYGDTVEWMLLSGIMNLSWAVMNFNDQSRSCHAECVSRSPECSEGEASLGPSRQTFRGVYPECNEWAQDDKPLPILVVKIHYCQIQHYRVVMPGENKPAAMVLLAHVYLRHNEVVGYPSPH